MRDPVYEERYCAFVDILGFRNLIQGLRDQTTDPQKIKNLLIKCTTQLWGSARNLHQVTFER